jgi:hypothetical protein
MTAKKTIIMISSGAKHMMIRTLNLSDKNHGCRPHLRGSVRRASGFVLTADST